MKKWSYIMFFFVFTIITSCQKDPEKYPLEQFTEDYVFDAKDPNGTLALQYLTNIYSYIPSGFNRVSGDFLDVATDDALPSRNVNGGIEVLRTTRMTSASSNPDGFWETGYTGIRKSNIFLSKIDVVPFSLPEINKYVKAEARFLRAYFYYELLKRYGGVPIIGDVVYNPTDNMNLKRNSFEEVVEYIVSECDAIALDARPDNNNLTNDPNWGRATKGVILTLKAKVLNLAASPLYNGENIAQGDPQRESLQGYSSYSQARWERAAKAAKDVIDLNLYSLSGIQNLFIQRKNAEMIFAVLRPTTRDLMQLTGPIGFFETNTSGQGLVSPTQELVDAFPMTNGKPITDPSYSPTDPYANRDQRLTRSVFLNNTQWLRRPLEMFEGGLDKPNQAGRVQTRTGYYSKKYLNFNFQTSFEYSLQHINYQIFRYADVLLMRAEALNESNPTPPTEVYDLLKLIRARAGHTASNNFGVPTSFIDQEEAREFIQNEKRIEFFLEEHRYWDVRRWKLAETLFNKKLHGMKITKVGNTFNYERVEVGEIAFDKRMYFYPIPLNEVLNNSNMVQNLGW